MANRKPRVNNSEFFESQIRLISNARWEEVFQILEFIMNDIYPDDFNSYAEENNIKSYFKNKYEIKLR